jgi:hypothetical protein
MDEALEEELSPRPPVEGRGLMDSRPATGPETQIPGAVGRGCVFMRYRTYTV